MTAGKRKHAAFQMSGSEYGRCALLLELIWNAKGLRVLAGHRFYRIDLYTALIQHKYFYTAKSYTTLDRYAEIVHRATHTAYRSYRRPEYVFLETT